MIPNAVVFRYVRRELGKCKDESDEVASQRYSQIRNEIVGESTMKLCNINHFYEGTGRPLSFWWRCELLIQFNQYLSSRKIKKTWQKIQHKELHPEEIAMAKMTLFGRSASDIAVASKFTKMTIHNFFDDLNKKTLVLTVT